MLKPINTLWASLPPIAQNIIAGMIVFILFWIAAIIISTCLKHLRGKKHARIINLIAKIVRNVILVIGLISALGTAGVNVAALIASLGLASFAAGYALKDMLGNLIAGFMIMLNGTLKIGDHIMIDKYEGIVEAIRLRETILRQDDQRHYIPNGKFTLNALTIYDKGAQ